MKSKLKSFQAKKEVKVLSIQQLKKVNGKGTIYRVVASDDDD